MNYTCDYLTIHVRSEKTPVEFKTMKLPVMAPLTLNVQLLTKVALSPVLKYASTVQM